MEQSSEPQVIVSETEQPDQKFVGSSEEEEGGQLAETATTTSADSPMQQNDQLKITKQPYPDQHYTANAVVQPVTYPMAHSASSSPNSQSFQQGTISMGYVQEPGLIPPQYVHSGHHPHHVPGPQMGHFPYGMHGIPAMMHGMYPDGQYGNMYHLHHHHHHQHYQQGMYARPTEYGGGIGYARGFLPINGRNHFNGHNVGGRNRLNRGRGGRQYSRKAQLQDKLSSNKDRTVYVSEIDHSVTEEDLARLFSKCGEVVDCRLCGDAHSRMRFAFVEFSPETGEDAINKALQLDDHLLGSYPIRVLKSRTAIVPVKRDLMPNSESEMERCQRTIYVSNIDKRLSEKDVVNFFETLCAGEGDSGKVKKIRLLADNNHSTAIAFVEFVTPESASTALSNCQGALMGCLPLRVSPSKTPVRTPEEDRVLREARKAEGM
eukprot:TRINITY_DN5125_c0_g1_i6.p1 TRINITY_DN5125_c0_g1~~TRINITY_DN5125_c0_g1_i6.p1  ORF type:complete len:433 (+),score=46.14 TRINITY_DN5125_c0_g1_i6:223-1521(+)